MKDLYHRYICISTHININNIIQKMKQKPVDKNDRKEEFIYIM